MEKNRGVSWLNSNEVILRFVKRLVRELDELKEHLVELKENDVLFSQGESLEYIYLLLEGEVKLTRTQPDSSEVVLINLKPGNFAGLIAFTTGEPTLTTGRITVKGKAIKMRPSQFEQYLNDHPRFKHPLQQLMLNNMLQRYKSNLRLQTKTHLLSKELSNERNELKAAYKELEETHQMLVHREKMATLGELVAGFAHEVNNPAAALMRSAENLVEMYASAENTSITFQLFKLGLQSQPVDSATLREKMRALANEFPHVKDRSAIRKLAHMTDEAIELIKAEHFENNLSENLDHFEAGKMIQNIRISGTRIANLVKSLKSYSRQDQNKQELVDIREGLKDNILVLSHRLKFVDISLNLNEIPKTCVRVGDLNQVWTNIIVNACDAMEERGKLSVSTHLVDNAIEVVISDNGPGVPDEIKESIFAPDFTTKTKGSKFGLGLGLAISQKIILENGGQIFVEDAEGGGASFVVRLPVVSEC